MFPSFGNRKGGKDKQQVTVESEEMPAASSFDSGDSINDDGTDNNSKAAGVPADALKEVALEDSATTVDGAKAIGSGPLGSAKKLFSSFLPKAEKEDAVVETGVSGSDDSNKFGMVQRVDSLKSLVFGAIVGGLALSPVAAFHDIVYLGSVAQWEFDTDMGSLQTGLFAIAYRYATRMDSAANPQLPQGVVAAFCVTRTLSRVVVPATCSPIPLDCGAPLGYFNWDMLTQLGLNGLESLVMFGATAIALEFVMNRGWISRFPA